MFEIIDSAAALVPKYMLVLARLSGMMATFPILSSVYINKKTKAYIAIMFTLIIAPVLGPLEIEMGNVLQVIFAVSKEVIIGLIIGFGTKVIFSAFTMAGNVVGRKMGLLMARTFDPNARQQVPLFSQFFGILIMVYFIVTNAHHLFIETIFENFKSIPPGEGFFSPALGRNMIKTGSLMYKLAIKFGGPTVILLLLLEVSVGIAVRVLPQMNAFFITLPLRIIGGLFAVMSSMKIFQLLFDSVYGKVVSYIGSAIMQIRG